MPDPLTLLRQAASAFAAPGERLSARDLELRRTALAYACELLVSSGESGTTSAAILLRQFSDELAPADTCVNCRGKGARIPYTTGPGGCPTCGVLEPAFDVETHRVTPGTHTPIPLAAGHTDHMLARMFTDAPTIEHDAAVIRRQLAAMDQSIADSVMAVLTSDPGPVGWVSPPCEMVAYPRNPTRMEGIVNAAAKRFDERPLYRASVEARAELGRIESATPTDKELARVLSPADREWWRIVRKDPEACILESISERSLDRGAPWAFARELWLKAERDQDVNPAFVASIVREYRDLSGAMRSRAETCVTDARAVPITNAQIEHLGGLGIDRKLDGIAMVCYAALGVGSESYPGARADTRKQALEHLSHVDHGRGTAEDGPDDSDCGCRPDDKQQLVCAMTGCGFCRTARYGKATAPAVPEFKPIVFDELRGPGSISRMLAPMPRDARPFSGETISDAIIVAYAKTLKHPESRTAQLCRIALDKSDGVIGHTDARDNIAKLISNVHPYNWVHGKQYLGPICTACAHSPDPRGWSACHDCRALRERATKTGSKPE